MIFGKKEPGTEPGWPRSLIFNQQGGIDGSFTGISDPQPDDLELINQNFKELKFYILEPEDKFSIDSYTKKFSEFIINKQFDIALLEYIEMSFFLSYIPKSTITILDTHDILSDKIAAFAKWDIPHEGIMSVNFEEEIEIFSRFDYVILINKIDFKKVESRIAKNKSLLVPHPVYYAKREIRKNVESIAFVASIYKQISIRWNGL